MTLKSKDLVSVEQLEEREIERLFMLTGKIKRNRRLYRRALDGAVLALIFEKPSLRTRFTFETGIYELGGTGIYLGRDEIRLGTRETIYDAAKNIERWAHGAVIRTFSHRNVQAFASSCRIPVINGLDDLLHPCQALTDLFTLKERKGPLKRLTVAWVGDGNNVLHSLMWASAKTGVTLKAAVPEGYEPDPYISETATGYAAARGTSISIVREAGLAVEGADAVYTDVWTSMGKEAEAEVRRGVFFPFRVDAGLMRRAKPDAIFMHCLPAHRGEEVTDELIDAPYSVVFDQAENRLHLQKALLLLLLKKGPKE
ncbi:MAG: ornithine carbamoyltransferase [Spirochaetes bacterium]|nr:ornithine carbamoyltransferase [Spirochaetota bacterium]